MIPAASSQYVAAAVTSTHLECFEEAASSVAEPTLGRFVAARTFKASGLCPASLVASIGSAERGFVLDCAAYMAAALFSKRVCSTMERSASSAVFIEALGRAGLAATHDKQGGVCRRRNFGAGYRHVERVPEKTAALEELIGSAADSVSAAAEWVATGSADRSKPLLPQMRREFSLSAKSACEAIRQAALIRARSS